MSQTDNIIIKTWQVAIFAKCQYWEIKLAHNCVINVKVTDIQMTQLFYILFPIKNVSLSIKSKQKLSSNWQLSIVKLKSQNRQTDKSENKIVWQTVKTVKAISIKGAMQIKFQIYWAERFILWHFDKWQMTKWYIS